MARIKIGKHLSAKILRAEMSIVPLVSSIETSGTAICVLKGGKRHEFLQSPTGRLHSKQRDVKVVLGKECSLE